MNDWLLWQLADSAFPTGGFTHSGGLEAAWQRGWIRDADSLAEFLANGASQITRGVLCFMRKSWQERGQFLQIDRDCDLFLNNSVANRASRAQGSALLGTAARTFCIPELAELAKEARNQQMPSHLAPVFGVVSKHCGLAERRGMELFLFTSLRGIISAAVRLGIVGPMQAQQIQARLAETALGEIERKTEEPVQISPLFDLVQGTQNRLYSRLFQS